MTVCSPTASSYKAAQAARGHNRTLCSSHDPASRSKPTAALQASTLPSNHALSASMQQVRTSAHQAEPSLVARR
eukprot:12043820-Alexandrium_andersonii.AAC.1